MGASRWDRRRSGRLLAVSGLAALGIGAMTACQPTDLGSATVAYTTDSTATAELNRRHVDVSWLTCVGHQGDSASPAKSGSPSTATVVSVDCQGRTKDGKKTAVTGEVTRAVNGVCVRGHLTATVDGRRIFRVSGLGDCDAKPSSAYTPPATYRPPGQPRPTVTVTVTRTLWCKGDPTCWPVEGK
ncbi:hypothetical protein ACIQMP_22410 [Streptomyces sp. NPDC091385]|uniref:hypothetical protein n=1 Tax=Streptomyces sp. NPDC091385 TaxID=3365997 RepID=UPI00381C9F00